MATPNNSDKRPTLMDWASQQIQRLTGRVTVPAINQPPVYLEQSPGVNAEIGWGGAPIFSGIVLDEYNTDLQGKKALETLDKMRRTSAQVRAVEKVISLPIRSTPWIVDEPDNPSAAEKEATQLLRENLFGGMERSWDDLLREACLAIYSGWRIPEIVWQEKAGLISIRKVASRNPMNLERWLYDGSGTLAGYIYTGSDPLGDGVDGYNYGYSLYRRIPIAIEKTLHFVYDQENENPQGFGLWRSMYPHWYILQATYKIMGIGVERNLLGTPLARPKEGSGAEGTEAQTADRQAMLTMLSSIKASGTGAVALPPGWDVEWFEGKRTVMDAMPWVYHHDAKLAQAAMASFINLGQGEVGTQAVGSVLAALFQQAEDGNARWIEQTIQRQLIDRWVLLNYGAGMRSPVLSHKPIKAQDLMAWGQALQALTTGGWLTPNVDDEIFIRDTMELPAIPEDQIETRKEHEAQMVDANNAAQLAGAKALSAAPAGLQPKETDAEPMNGKTKVPPSRKTAKEKV